MPEVEEALAPCQWLVSKDVAVAEGSVSYLTGNRVGTTPLFLDNMAGYFSRWFWGEDITCVVLLLPSRAQSFV